MEKDAPTKPLIAPQKDKEAQAEMGPGNQLTL